MNAKDLINHSGKHVRCLIDKTIIDDCIITYDNDLEFYKFYLCQNYRPGTPSPNKHGYKYIWFFKVSKHHSMISPEMAVEIGLINNYIKDLELL